MAGDFSEKVDELIEQVGHGKLTLRANVHQPYAAAEHQRQYYRHPRGGMPDYLQTPFEAGREEMLEELAEAFPDVKEGAVAAVQKFEDWVQTYAPVQFDVLRQSTNLYVEEEGGNVFEKPQAAPYESWKE
jgi:hypothetical protein